MSARAAEQAASLRPTREQLRERWRQMIDDPLLAAIPYKVELNEKGAIEVSPASNRHGILQAFVASELRRRLPDGTTITECSIETEIGVRVPDVAWASADFMARHGVTTLQFTTLSVLSRHGAPLSTSQLARRAFMTPQSMSEVIHALEDKGLIKRNPHPSHRRKLPATLTAKGRRVLAACEEDVSELEGAMLEDFSDADREEFLAMMKAAARNLGGGFPQD